MYEFEPSQKDESRAQSADSSRAYRKTRAFICHLLPLTQDFAENMSRSVMVWWDLHSPWKGFCRKILEYITDSILPGSFYRFLQLSCKFLKHKGAAKLVRLFTSYLRFA